MDRYQLVCKIHELRSYIASDWPGIEERKNLYEALYQLEALLKRGVDEEDNKPKED